MSRFIRTYWPSLLIALAIIYLSLSTGRGLTKLPPIPPFENADKLMHFLMYMGMSGALCIDMHRDGKNALWIGLIAFIGSTLLGGALELLQPLFPPRTCDLLDFIADAAGAGLGYIIVDIVWTKTRLSIK